MDDATPCTSCGVGWVNDAGVCDEPSCIEGCIDPIAAIAKRTGASKSDVYRLAMAHGLERAERELANG